MKVSIKATLQSLSLLILKVLLMPYGTKASYTNFIKQVFVVNATLKVNDVEQDISDLDTGACQGSSSAAVMFTFNIRDMMKNVKSCRIKYSDDGNLYITGPPEKAQGMANLLSQDLNNISKWCFKWRTPINISKTKYMIWNRQNFDTPIDISIQSIASDQPLSSISLTRSTQERILGVIVDEKLFCPSHGSHRQQIFLCNESDQRFFNATSRSSH